MIATDGATVNNKTTSIAESAKEILKPRYRLVLPDSIPPELKGVSQWVVWSAQWNGKKWTKPPFDAKTGAAASTDDPTTWTDFETALLTYQSGGYDGIGFVLTKDLSLVGFDFDHCAPGGEISLEVKGYLDKLQSYAEFSPTDGIRALAFGRKPGSCCKLPPKGYEVYETGRYLTITGHPVNGFGNVEERQPEIEEVYRAIFTEEKTPSREDRRSPFADFADISDQKLLEKAFKSKSGAEIQTLYSGNTARYSSQSEADLALCNHLAYWTGRDAGRMDRIFRSSGLMREKWDERHGKTTYGNMTTNKAIAGCTNTYEPNGGHQESARGQERQGANQDQRTADEDQDEWGNIVPLGAPRPLAMPEGIIPGPVGAMVKSVSCFTETPYELAAGLSLVAVASAVAGKYEVQVKRGYSEPLNIMVVAALETGNRKTSVVEALFKPHLEWEQAVYELMKPEIDRVSAKNAAIEARLKKLNSDYAKAEDATARADILKEIQGTKEEIEPLPVPPRVIFDDITPEHMGTMAALHNGRMALVSDEGGIFDILAGRYSKNGAPNLDLFLKGYSGSSVRVDRGSREPVIIDNPALSLGISPQPETLVRLGAMPGFRARGVMARIGFLLPESRLGFRSLCGPEIPASVTIEYDKFIKKLLDEESGDGPERIELSSEAYREWKDFALYVEEELRPGGKYENIKDWCGKLPGFAARLSGLIHIMGGGGPEISLATMGKALELASVFVDHTLFAFDVIGEDESFDVARKIWTWVDRTGQNEFSKRDCFTALKGCFSSMDKIEPGFKTLEEHNFIRVEKISTGGRPSYLCYVNPTAFGGV